MKTDKYDALRLVIAELIIEEKEGETLGESSDIIEKHLQRIVKLFTSLDEKTGKETPVNNTTGDFERIKHLMIGKACSLNYGTHNDRYNIALELFEGLLESRLLEGKINK